MVKKEDGVGRLILKEVGGGYVGSSPCGDEV